MIGQLDRDDRRHEPYDRKHQAVAMTGWLLIQPVGLLTSQPPFVHALLWIAGRADPRDASVILLAGLDSAITGETATHHQYIAISDGAHRPGGACAHWTGGQSKSRVPSI